jgi:hypothetical protein
MVLHGHIKQDYDQPRGVQHQMYKEFHGPALCFVPLANLEKQPPPPTALFGQTKQDYPQQHGEHLQPH